ncbi:haloacid dehalogenase type II [Noviherbaspirillum pedocola]|uniref:(S)-2-haloacid dehalogenase n=1 Tax=Noviherbaspirillum pedocola TaxID=2801341 RepID=A0A934SSG9_9BURK|nr:haloacid dehalogenase type II [Noviherbaspirillum pedocola]MBK4735765.1 haloacid dehalogenase type II [Noviherbaspirillum pedocola]
MKQEIRALAFDVFGTVVDWHRGIREEAAALAGRHGIDGDWARFAREWRAGYPRAMDQVRNGELPWTRIDALHRLILDDIAPRFGLASLPETELAQLNLAWHRLPAWPDVVEGLTLLKRQRIITTLSNGNVSLLVDMARHAGLPWDCVISAELFRHYKPDPEAYLGCADLLGIAPGELMMVACHPSDLRAAREQGLRTAYVVRPLEMGQAKALPEFEQNEFDFVVDSFIELARRLE